MSDVFDILMVHEDGYSNLLKQLFNESEAFRKNFLEKLFGENQIKRYNDWQFVVRKVIKTENRRKFVPDILLYSLNEEALAIIEVKVGASEGEKQTLRYYEAEEIIKSDLQLKSCKTISRRFLTIFPCKASCEEYKNMIWKDIGECLDEDVFEQLEGNTLLLEVAKQLNTRIISAYLAKVIDLTANWQETMKPELWRGARNFYDAFRTLEIFKNAYLSHYWNQFDAGSNKYLLSANFTPKEHWVGECLEGIQENYDKCYEFHFEIKYDPRNLTLTCRLDYHLHPYHSKNDINLLESPLKGIADRCNKERIDIAKKARKNWKACNKNSEIAFSGRIDDRLMVLMSFSIKIEENSTIKSVLDSIEGKLQIMADFLEENVLKGLKQ